MIDEREMDNDYDVVVHICDIFDAYLLREEFGSEYVLEESDAFRNELLRMFDEEDAIL